MQTVGPEVSTVGVQTEVSHMQVVRETTYASVASQACPEGSLGVGGEDVEMVGVGGGPAEPPPVPVVLLVPATCVPKVVQVQALLIHGVDCRRGMGALLVAARSLQVGECTVRGVRWLLGVGRRWGKPLSLLVVYLDRPVVVCGHSVWFGGSLHPVERYVFERYWGVVWVGVSVLLVPEGVILYCFFFLFFCLLLCMGQGYQPPSM